MTDDAETASGETDGQIAFQFRLAYLRTWVGLVAALSRFDIRPEQYAVLSFVEHRPGCSQREISDAFRFERPKLSQMVEELVELDLMVRARGCGDRRANALTLSSKGLAFVTKLHGCGTRYNRQVMTRLKARQKRQLLSLVALVNDTPLKEAGQEKRC